MRLLDYTGFGWPLSGYCYKVVSIVSIRSLGRKVRAFRRGIAGWIGYSGHYRSNACFNYRVQRFLYVC